MTCPFDITVATNSVRLDAKQQGEATFTVFNRSGRPVRGRGQVAAQQPEAAAWLAVAGESERNFAIAGAEQFSVRLTVPTGAAAGNYAFRLDMVGVENPDEEYCAGPSVTFVVPEPAPSKPFPWWIVAVVAVVLIGAGVAFWLWPRGVAVPDVRGQTLEEAQAALTAVGLQGAATVVVESSGIGGGLVIASTPAPGTRIAAATPVALLVAATPTVTPTPMPEPEAILISAGTRHTCAISSRGGVQCWGDNEFGKLGNGFESPSLTPVDVVGLERDVIAVAADWQHTCALTAAGSVQCWGANYNGQLGNGRAENSPRPVDVIDLEEGARAITTGEQYACALTHAGGVKCWGENYGNRPVDLPGLTSAVDAIVAGDRHTCAIVSGGGVKCWGEVPQERGIPTGFSIRASDVPGLSDVVALAAGSEHTCALSAGGGVQCWGHNYFGQLGDGSQNHHATPVDVSGLTTGVHAIAAGGDTTCALMTLGGVKCWGAEMGVAEPVNVANLYDSYRALTVGYAHSCVLSNDQAVLCWGLNDYGQLGDGTIVTRDEPVKVVGFTP